MGQEVFALPNVATPSNPVSFNSEKCNGCNQCIETCQVDVFIPNPKRAALPSFFILMNAGIAAAVLMIVIGLEQFPSIGLSNKGAIGRTRLREKYRESNYLGIRQKKPD